MDVHSVLNQPAITTACVTDLNRFPSLTAQVFQAKDGAGGEARGGGNGATRGGGGAEKGGRGAHWRFVPRQPQITD